MRGLFTLPIFAIIYSYLLYKLNPSLLFLNTTIAGGDTGSHNYIVYYLKEIFPSLRGWSHDWYGGFPFLYFYPPLLYILAVILSYVIPINVAFKLITILGTLLLPISIYLSFKILKLKSPIPHIGALFSLSFIFLENYSIYGGNLPSTLAGEFSYSFSFSLFWIFIASLKRGMEENRYLLLNIILLSLMVLSHPIPVILSLFVLIFLLFAPNLKERILYISKIYCLAFIITSFWSLPFLWYMDYTSIMRWWRIIKLSDIFPQSLIPLQVLALPGIIYSLLKKDNAVNILLIIAFVSLIPYLLLNDSKILNARFLPFFTMSSVMIAGYFIGTILSRIPIKLQSYLILPILAITVVIWTEKNLTYIPQWIKWNYEGFEKKDSWVEIKPLFEYLKTLPYGRVMWEYTPQYDRYGTPRILENIPLFAKQPTVEGLLIESSISSPFHFINQAETTKTPTTPISGFEYPEFDMKKAIVHMRLFGIRYFIAYTEETKKTADALLPRLATIGNFMVFEIPEVSLIAPLYDFTIEKKTKDWIFKSIDWYKNGDLSRPIIFADKITGLEKSQNRNNVRCVILTFKRDYIEFYTNGIGTPHLVKVSYFSKWSVKGADGPYLASPAFMVVIPRSNYVKLYF